jgi:hypothetical protein
MAETFQWGKTLLWIAGNFRPPNMDSASILYRVAAAFFKQWWRVPSTRHTEHTLIRFQTTDILPPCPIAHGGNTPYHLTEQKRILMGEIISIMEKLFS